MQYLLFLILLLCSCALPPRVPQPLRHLYIRADVSFTLRERALLQQAIARLEHQTGGLLAISIDYADEPTLLRTESSGKQVPELDAGFHGSVYGWTSVASGRMYLVGDRLKTDDLFVHVAMHEMLHLVGVEHSKSESSVMYYITNDNQHVLCMDRSDAQQFCGVMGCRIESLNYCGR